MSNVMVARMDDPGSPFEDVNRLSEMFGQHAGSEIATRTTYLPTGEIVHIGGYNNVTFLRRNGCRTFPANDFDWMLDWMAQYAPQDLVSIDIARKDLLK